MVTLGIHLGLEQNAKVFVFYLNDFFLEIVLNLRDIWEDNGNACMQVVVISALLVHDYVPRISIIAV